VKKIPCFVRNPKVHYRIHKHTPPFSVLSQINPVHVPNPSSWRSGRLDAKYRYYHHLQFFVQNFFPCGQYLTSYEKQWFPCIRHDNKHTSAIHINIAVNALTQFGRKNMQRHAGAHLATTAQNVKSEGKGLNWLLQLPILYWTLSAVLLIFDIHDVSVIIPCRISCLPVYYPKT
jgi:hypothetical protein